MKTTTQKTRKPDLKALRANALPKKFSGPSHVVAEQEAMRMAEVAGWMAEHYRTRA